VSQVSYSSIFEDIYIKRIHKANVVESNRNSCILIHLTANTYIQQRAYASLMMSQESLRTATEALILLSIVDTLLVATFPPIPNLAL